jgi:hypothetical protein
VCQYYDYIKSAAAKAAAAKDNTDVTFLINLVTDGKVVTEADWIRFNQKLIELTPRQRTDFWIQMRTLLTEPEWNFAHDLYVRTALRQKWGKGS